MTAKISGYYAAVPDPFLVLSANYASIILSIIDLKSIEHYAGIMGLLLSDFPKKINDDKFRLNLRRSNRETLA